MSGKRTTCMVVDDIDYIIMMFVIIVPRVSLLFVNQCYKGRGLKARQLYRGNCAFD